MLTTSLVLYALLHFCEISVHMTPLPYIFTLDRRCKYLSVLVYQACRPPLPWRFGSKTLNFMDRCAEFENTCREDDPQPETTHIMSSPESTNRTQYP